MPFQIIRNDITKVKADAIVNTANPNAAVGDGVDSAIYKVAGREKLLEARKKIGLLMPGEVALTEAFDLDAKFIIHASGPWWQGGEEGEPLLLKQCFDNSLQLAWENDCRSIAFPLLATGTYGFPKRLAIEIAVQSFRAFLQDHDMEIMLVVFGNEAVNISGELVDEVRSFVDDHYVKEALSEEYRSDRFYLEECQVGAPLADSSLGEDDYDEDLEDSDEMVCASVINSVEAEPAESLDDALKSIYTESFEKYLQKLINKKGLKNSQVYAAANISKQYFSKLLKGQVKPSKEKVLALAIGLTLNLDEAVDFLRIAGYALSPISQTDTIVEYFIRNKDYNVLKIDIVLFDYGLEPLSNA